MFAKLFRGTAMGSRQNGRILPNGLHLTQGAEFLWEQPRGALASRGWSFSNHGSWRGSAWMQSRIRPFPAASSAKSLFPKTSLPCTEVVTWRRKQSPCAGRGPCLTSIDGHSRVIEPPHPRTRRELVRPRVLRHQDRREAGRVPARQHQVELARLVRRVHERDLVASGR